MGRDVPFRHRRGVTAVMEARSSGISGSIPARERRPQRVSAARPGAIADGAHAVELRTAAEGQGDLEAWRGLARRPLGPSLFGEPEVLLPAMQHLPDGRHVVLLLVWQTGAAGRALRGLFPVVMPRVPLAPGEIRLWQPGLLGFGMPLVDEERPAEIVAAALSFCASRGTRYGSLMLPRLPAQGRLAEALAAMSRSSARRLERLPDAGREAPLLALTDAGRLRAGAHRSGLGGSGFTVEHARGPL